MTHPSPARALLLFAALLALSACAFKGDEFRQRRQSAGAWPLRPLSIRFHPFTRMIRDAEKNYVVEARIEMLDPAGDACKGIGEFRFELYADPATESRAGHERRLFQWLISIDRLEDNSLYWDPVTRCYSIPLKLDIPPPQHPRLQLHVQFDSPAGDRLSAETEVEGPQ